MSIWAVINHLIVLMLENRSFDHMLGFAARAGTDAGNGGPTDLTVLAGDESNQVGAESFSVRSGAPYALDFDPGHEFSDVLQQLTGSTSPYPAGQSYPAIDNSGFAANAMSRTTGTSAAAAPALVMAGFAPAQLPVLNTLAQEFAVCDHWFASLPGPTWPNRLFVHAASSGGLDDSPSALQSGEALLQGYGFENGTIFDRLDQAGRSWSIVEGDALPQTLSLAGMVERALAGRFVGLQTFLDRIARPDFGDAYTFIEPHYGHVLADGRNFKCGNSQHPLDDATRGEQLLKVVYEGLRRSPHWSDSALVVIYDEHGGFYDHVAPPAAVPPGDRPVRTLNKNGFGFDQLGVRIPALVISAYTPKGGIDHTTYDHSAVPATLEKLFGLAALTRRDAAASPLDHLWPLTSERDDAPLSLPRPAASGIPDCEDSLTGQLAADLESLPAHLAGPLEPALVGFLQVAIARELHLAAAAQRDAGRALASARDRLLGLYDDATQSKFAAVKLLRNVEMRYRGAQR